MGAHGDRFRNRSSRRRRPAADLGALRLTTVLVAAGAALALLPVTAMAASPSPSPSLDKVLVSPVATGFVEISPGQGVEGPITSQQIATAGTNANQDEQALSADGFVGGYGRTWFDQAKKHELQEVVIAFRGGAGAVKWLGSSESTDRANQYFIHTVPVGGIPSYYAVHLADPPQSAYVDIIGFVKGNDYFLIAAASTSDDLDTSTAMQAKGQYDFAPSNTIPPSEWPEHPGNIFVRTATLASGLGSEAIVIALLIALVVLAVMLIRRRRTGLVLSTAAIAGVQMSPDGSYWWDGQGWRDAAQETPPAALRSGDGFYWWDGRVWRLMPKSSTETPTEKPAEPS
jgi:hypothetical protein